MEKDYEEILREKALQLEKIAEKNSERSERLFNSTSF